MRRFKSSLSMCFPHKYWVKEWQTYHNKTHDDVKCKEKYQIHRITPPLTYVYDDQTQHRCFVCKTLRTDALAVNNWNAYHICVDGGLIRFGCRIYMLDPIYKTNFEGWYEAVEWVYFKFKNQNGTQANSAPSILHFKASALYYMHEDIPSNECFS